ncbi:MAG: hypothetical protein WBZ48_06750 [Bacteroidota bacterium]
MMDIRQKTNLISALIIVISLALTFALYVFFKIFFLFIIFVPPVIYYLLKKKNNGNNPFDGPTDG